jgi:hypothetical protein
MKLCSGGDGGATVFGFGFAAGADGVAGFSSCD